VFLVSKVLPQAAFVIPKASTPEHAGENAKREI
jgi:hypothetical protein